ncbi:MAG: AAA family ATPase [bacterium]|nr:AAA family ATPase [bacterium]
MENNKLGSSIAVMNAKGGVGKSTVTLAIAETLSYYYGKKVLVIDSDAQMSISVMLMPFDDLNQKRSDWKTLVGLLHQTLILGQTPDWKDFVTSHVSDVDDTHNIDLLPGDLRLTLVERAVTEADRHEQMRGLVRSVLAEARLKYDYVFIDCPPGLSLLTEIWLREADYHLAPVKPDFLAIAGLEMFREFKKINPDLKMAQNLGILVNMKNRQSAEDDIYHAILTNDEESNCFPDAIPHMAPIQHAARFNPESRSFTAKYPGSAGDAFRNTVHELLLRIGDAQEAFAQACDEEVDENNEEPVEEVIEAQVEAEVEVAPEVEALDESKVQAEPAAQIETLVEIAEERIVETEPVEAVETFEVEPVVQLRRPAGIPRTVDIASRFAPTSTVADMVSAKAIETVALASDTPASQPSGFVKTAATDMPLSRPQAKTPAQSSSGFTSTDQ